MRTIEAEPEALRSIALTLRNAFRGRPLLRRTVQAIAYEGVAVLMVGPSLALVFGAPMHSALLLAVLMSTIAVSWNFAFNWLFERWEAGQAVKGRSLRRRLAHGAGFEGGLVLVLVPIMAAWLDTTLLKALLADLTLLAFFFVYTVAFTWGFDRLFGLPQSAVAGGQD